MRTNARPKQQRFRDSLSNLKKAAEGLKEGSKERKRIEGVIGKLGEEGKGNVKINFGDAGKTDGLPNLGKTVGNSITINYDAVDSEKTENHLNASESSALDAGVTGHEGTHAGGGPSVTRLFGNEVVVVFPERVKPAPGFSLVRDDSLTKLLDSVRGRKGVEATFEGRFDAAFIWRDHKKIAVGTDAGYGKKKRYGGRIVLREVSDVLARPKPHR